MEMVAKRTAQILLDIGAVNISQGQPFTLTSGALSPVYVDCRRIIAFLKERREITAFACHKLERECDLDAVDYIAGGETAGIAYAAWISEALGKPMLYVRKKPKGFGKGARIEGHMREGARVLLVEDLTTDGGSKVAFAEALREAGAEISDVFSVFFYGTRPESERLFAEAKLSLHALATWRDVLAVAREGKKFPEGVLADVESFLADPAGWSQARTGRAGAE